MFQNATLVSDQLRHPINAAERIDGIVNDEVRLYDSVMPNGTGYYTRDDGGAGGESDEHLELVYRRADESNSEGYMSRSRGTARRLLRTMEDRLMI